MPPPPLTPSWVPVNPLFSLARYPPPSRFIPSFSSPVLPSGQIGSVWEWYHRIGVEKDINRYRGFWFFNFSSENLKRHQNSEPLHTWIQPPACSYHGLYRILSSYWLAHFYLLKNSAKGMHYFGWIAGCWNSSNVLFTTRIPKINCWHFWSTDRGEKIMICAHTNRDPTTSRRLDSFLYEAAQNFEVFSKIQIVEKPAETLRLASAS